MSLAAGGALAHYRITGAIGAGGMGEVFRARDTKLDRDVAIKVLPAAFGQDAERVARFKREAQILASLNHPNIAAIHGLEEADGTLALAMDLIEGEDLAQRLMRGAIPVDEALAIARQIAEALEEAHEHGIVHRDLKPANVKVTRDGKVKVLDFGLARAIQGDVGNSGSAEVSHSPTMTHQATVAGVILGTAAYMSPEQARGRKVDKRADIWSFGVVLFELLTGKRLFGGETVSDVLAAVLTREADWSALPPATPRSVERLLRRCLDRDVRRRLQSIAEARIVLEAPPANAPEASGPTARARFRPLGLAPWLVAVIAVAAARAGWWSRSGPQQPARAVRHFEVSFPPDIETVASIEGSVNLSPDGALVSITGFKGTSRRLQVRRLATDETLEVGAESDNVVSAAFSPDSRSVAFFNNGGVIVRWGLADQQRTILGRGADATGGIAWGPAGIVFTRAGNLWLIPSAGGPERQLTTLDPARHEVLHSNAAFPPGGRSILFSSYSTTPGFERVEAVSTEGGPRTVVMERATTPIWSPTGHLLFLRDGAVFATSFDPVAGKAGGDVTRVIGLGVARSNFGSASLRLSQSGDLLFAPTSYRATQLVSVARDGAETLLPLESLRRLNPRVSPDGRRVMVEALGLRIDVFDFERQTVSRLTPEHSGTGFSMWSRDGSTIFYRRLNAPYWSSTTGDGQGGLVPSGAVSDYLSGPGPDADTFFSTRIQPDTSGDVYLLSRTGKFEPKPLVRTPAYDGGAQLSPDGRWLVYVSGASGQFETIVARYPALDRSWSVSAGAGTQPRWRRDGREIFYRDNQSVMAVPFDGSRDVPVLGKPVPLFKDDYERGQGSTIANYDVTPDGRFVMLRRDARGANLKLVLNWSEELRAIIAAGGVK
jgi:serine/threonine protein kinase